MASSMRHGSKPVWGGGKAGQHLVRGTAPPRTASTPLPATAAASSDAFATAGQQQHAQKDAADPQRQQQSSELDRKLQGIEEHDSSAASTSEAAARSADALCEKRAAPHLQKLLAARGRLLQDMARSRALDGADAHLQHCCTMHEAFLAGISLGAGHSRGGAGWLSVLLAAACGACAAAVAALTAASAQPYFPPPT